MLKVQGQRANSAHYLHEGYAYHWEDAKSVYRCVLRQSRNRCQGAAVVEAYGRVRMTKMHSHSADPNQEEKITMVGQMRRLACESHRPLKEIFDTLCLKPRCPLHIVVIKSWKHEQKFEIRNGLKISKGCIRNDVRVISIDSQSGTIARSAGRSTNASCVGKRSRQLRAVLE